jgi:carboxyl-terminal processing protease
LGITPDIQVRESWEERPTFGGEKEADYNRVLTNQGGTGQHALTPRSDIPAIAKQIPERPPESFPKFDATRPDATDFQLQQAVVLAQAMAAQKSASSN